MERIAMIGDIHLGPRCEQDGIRSKMVAGQARFIDSMIGQIEAMGIHTAVFLGDIFTTRSSVGVDAINYAIGMFERLHSIGVDSHIICGNHDLVYDDVDTMSSLRVLEHVPGVHIYRGEVSHITLLGRDWYMVPWIVPARVPSVVEWLARMANKGNIEKNVIVGHFDMMGMLMEAGQISTSGIEPSLFAGAAAHVYSGHYHCRSTKLIGQSEITYLGSPYHLSFAHVGTDCGWYVLDDSMNLEFIENTISPRFTECYDDQLDNLPDLTNTFVRYFALSTRNFDDALARKKLLSKAHPLYIKTIPYGGEGGSIEEVKRIDDNEARAIMTSDSITIAGMFMDRYPDGLPKFSTGEDPKAKIIELLHGIDARAK